MLFKKKKINIESELAFFWREENFITYAWPEYINSFEYTLSIFEREESSFDPDVTNLFVKIADTLTKGTTVLHAPEKEIQGFSCLGIEKDLFRQQLDDYHGWDETELFCYYNGNVSRIDRTIVCDLYFMIDVVHANMTIKCSDEKLFEKIKILVNETIMDMNYRLEKWESGDND